MIGLLAAACLAAADPQVVRPDPATGTAAAVVVGNVPLVHTAQVVPDAAGDAAAQAGAVLDRLDVVLKAAGSGLGRTVKLNLYLAADADADAVLGRLAERFAGPHKPAVTLVRGALPRPGVRVAADAVASADKVAPRTADAATLPAGSRVYVSGQAEKGKTLAEATRATLESLRRTLAWMKLGDEHVVQAKAFLNPVASLPEVRGAFAEFYGAGKGPPLVFVEWGAGGSIEIELVAASPHPPAKDADVVEYLTPPGMTASPVYCRAARAHADRTIYVGGLYAEKPGDGAAQVADVFRQLGGVLKETGGDFRHLVKATYYVSDDDASKRLNDLRPRYYDPRRPPAASKAPVAGTGRAGRSLTIDMIAVPRGGG